MMMEALSPLPPTVEVEDFAFPPSSPHSLPQPFSSPPAPPLADQTPTVPDYSYLIDDYGDSASNTDLDDNAPAEGDGSHLSADDRRLSGVSSISSFPASVSQHAVPFDLPQTPSRSPFGEHTSHSRAGSLNQKITSPRAGRDYASAFRNPSSVLAMQMRDEDAESITPHHRRSDSRMSARSHRSSYSTHSSPTKRLSRSNQPSPQKGSKLKNEFPLVLLHCTLLPPAHNLLSSVHDDELLNAILPEEYQKRWALLQDRFASTEVKSRGILIPHPKEDYELLEERLLESLDLEKPRIRQNHFFKHDAAGADSGFESASQTEDDSEADVPGGVKCPDCGRKVRDGEDLDRKWEIKVYAANGLMRAGAWNAAWREMEKVDIEIGLWMPEEVKRVVTAKLEAFASSVPEMPMEEEMDERHSLHEYDAREREIYGHSDPERTQEETGAFRPSHPNYESSQSNLAELVLSYIQKATNDRRNVVIVLLSVLVLVCSLLGSNIKRPDGDPAKDSVSKPVEVVTTTITSTAVWTSTMTTSQMVESFEASSTTVTPEQSSVVIKLDDKPVVEEEEVLDLPARLAEDEIDT